MIARSLGGFVVATAVVAALIAAPAARRGGGAAQTFRCGQAGVPRMGFPNTTLNPDANAAFREDPPCDDQDLEHIVTKEHG